MPNFANESICLYFLKKLDSRLFVLVIGKTF